MIQISVKEEKVEGVYHGNDIRQGWIEVDSIPEPEQKEGYPILYYREGKLIYEYEPL